MTKDRRNRNYTDPRAFICRVAFANERRWICYDKSQTLKGNKGETKRSVVTRFIQLYGEREWTCYRGTMRLSEFAASCSAFQGGDD